MLLPAGSSTRRYSGLLKSVGERSFGLPTRSGYRHLNVQWRDVYQMNFISSLRKPAGIGAGAAADIEDHGWRRCQKAHEKLTSARTLKLPAADVQPICFIPGCVMATDFFCLWGL